MAWRAPAYLARAGLNVLVLERAGRIGGAVHTEATIPEAPGYRFDTCSVVHNLIRMTPILEELRLEEAGLEYVETDPFLTAPPRAARPPSKAPVSAPAASIPASLASASP
jgi:phytoene dehydrogenase-like protein